MRGEREKAMIQAYQEENNNTKRESETYGKKEKAL